MRGEGEGREGRRKRRERRREWRGEEEEGGDKSVIGGKGKERDRM